ncbi:hypothetical protein CVD28_01530 [Bacillus sp. M6-12]|uniref:hypothetical protein n=1 Tax=Bacillus sp. M6-12 TaxID=2054166 RepID=UPI000C776F96|nr:hypothetical protein [Bacillus sp. M6-12]PLS19116.1 hypothetical protein CVD28_01530 [Bacillus sp. M6-12]
MAVIQKDGVIIGLSNITSYYCEEDDIHDQEDFGTYECFDFTFTVNEENILSQIIGTSVVDSQIGTSFELCSGNIVSLIQMIEDGLNTGEYQEIEFLEPNFSFELKPNQGNPENPSFTFHIWLNSGNWEGIYGSTDVGARIPMKKTVLETFLEELKTEWNNREKKWYRDRDK